MKGDFGPLLYCMYDYDYKNVVDAEVETSMKKPKEPDQLT